MDCFCKTLLTLIMFLVPNLFIKNITQAVELRCFISSLHHYTVVPIDNSKAMINSTCFSSSLNTIFYAFGFNGSPESNDTIAVVGSYLSSPIKRNVVLVDWTKEAKVGGLGVLLTYLFSVAPNTAKVGHQLGAALVAIAEAGVNMNSIHLVGHSLGAHVMAFAEKYVKDVGKSISLITALDPAGPLFQGFFSLRGLDATSAQRVVVIHTDPIKYGMAKAVGTLDIWVNCGDSVQPGCPVGGSQILDENERCSHERSFNIYEEALKSPKAFIAGYADSCEDWKAQRGVTNHTVYIGDLMDTMARGNYYMTTNFTAPYGMSELGLEPNTVINTTEETN